MVRTLGSHHQSTVCVRVTFRIIFLSTNWPITSNNLIKNSTIVASLNDAVFRWFPDEVIPTKRFLPYFMSMFVYLANNFGDWFKVVNYSNPLLNFNWNVGSTEIGYYLLHNKNIPESNGILTFIKGWFRHSL